MGNRETLRQYLTYNKETSKIDNIFYNLSAQLQYLHSAGYCVGELNSDTILLEVSKDASFRDEPNFMFGSIVRTNNPEKDFSKNVKDLSKLAIGAFISVENGFCDYSTFDDAYISKYYEEMAFYLPNPEYFQSVIVDNDTSVYYNDFINQKSSGGKGNSRQMVKSNSYGKMYVPDEEAAFAKIVIYPVLIISVIMVIAILSKIL